MNRTRKLLVALVCLLTLPAAALSAQEQKSTKLPRVAIFMGGATPPSAAFHQRLRELGYIEGQTVTVVVRNAHGRLDQYPEVAADLVRTGADVIVVAGNAPLAALKAATQKIPIVMTVVADPVGAGFVASLAKPGGNITGLSNMAEGVSGKWLELIKHISPDATRVAVLRDPDNRAHAQMWGEVQKAARNLNVAPLAWNARSAQEIGAAFAAMAGERIGAVVVLPHPTATVNAAQIAALAIKQRLPTVSLNPANAERGLLLGYGPSNPDLWRRAADYVDRILKGARPADLPVEQPTTFELVVNLRTAKALGITIPPTVLLQATRVIE